MPIQTCMAGDYVRLQVLYVHSELPLQ